MAFERLEIQSFVANSLMIDLESKQFSVYVEQIFRGRSQASEAPSRSLSDVFLPGVYTANLVQ